MSRFILLLIGNLIIAGHLDACTSFFSDGQTKYAAKNFDWFSGRGYLIKNVSGQKKVAYGLRGNNQATWTSRFGSITFNQVGKEFPYGGMNEKGLVVEQLWMAESYYQDNGSETISELEWIQYQLDNYATIDEVIHNLNSLTIKPIGMVHYFVVDRIGNSAVIDFIEGKTVVNRKSGKFQVVTNDETYTDSEKYYAKNNKIISKISREPFDRFCQIKNCLENTEPVSPDQAFDILNNSSENQEVYKTYWAIVYDLTNLKIYYKSFENKTVKEFRLSAINFSTNSTTEACEINAANFSLKNYTFEMNEEMFKNALKIVNMKMEIKLDEKLACLHQMNPGENHIDKTYQENYSELKIAFSSKLPKGIIYYTLVNSEANFKTRKGVKSGILLINKSQNKRIIYAMPKGEFALACYQDADLDGKMDKKLFGIPKNYGFSGNRRGVFGTPPDYNHAKINLNSDQEILIKIR